MKEIIMPCDGMPTVGSAFESFLVDANVRGLSPDTIKGFRQKYQRMILIFPKATEVSTITLSSWNKGVMKMREWFVNANSRTIFNYLAFTKTFFKFCMRNGWMEEFDMALPKYQETTKEAYTDDEIETLLKKPNLRRASFTEYECWVIINLLMSSGLRKRSLINLKAKDLDFETKMLSVNITKNKKPIIVPLNNDVIEVLREFLAIRKPQNGEDWLFCNAYGEQLLADRLTANMNEYNRKRGVETTGIHRWRHTFAKQWVIAGGNIATLSRLLGHSSLLMTTNYVNLLVSDIQKEVEETNVLTKFKKKRITMR